MLALKRGAASMGAAVSITRLELTAAQLRAAAGREKDGSAARRMLAIAMVLDGADRGTAAETCGMDRQTLRDWVHRYNAEGIRGLHDLKTPGPKPKLTADQQAKLAELVEAGPDPARHGVVRWRRVDLRDELQRCFGVELHERSVGKVLAKLGYRRLSVRPRHPQTDEAAQAAFKKTSPQWSRHGCPTRPKTSPSKSGSRCYGDGLSRYFGSPNQSDGAATMQPIDTVNPTILLAIELSAATWLVALFRYARILSSLSHSAYEMYSPGLSLDRSMRSAQRQPDTPPRRAQWRQCWRANRARSCRAPIHFADWFR